MHNEYLLFQPINLRDNVTGREWSTEYTIFNRILTMDERTETIKSTIMDSEPHNYFVFAKIEFGMRGSTVDVLLKELHEHFNQLGEEGITEAETRYRMMLPHWQSWVMLGWTYRKGKASIKVPHAGAITESEEEVQRDKMEKLQVTLAHFLHFQLSSIQLEFLFHTSQCINY